MGVTLRASPRERNQAAKLWHVWRDTDAVKRIQGGRIPLFLESKLKSGIIGLFLKVTELQQLQVTPLVVFWIGQVSRDVIGRRPNVKGAVIGRFYCYFRSVYRLLRSVGFV